MKTAGRAIRTLLIALQALLVAVSLFESAVTVCGHLVRWRRRGPRPDPDARPRFGLIVCARNEQRVVGRLLHDLTNQSYPRELFEVVVVAHNCTDRTAEVAARSGFTVLSLHTARPGKSQAITAGLKQMSSATDYVGVFDADSRVTGEFLSALAARVGTEHAIQVESIPQRTDTWIGEGHGISRRARNVFWWRPRESLGLGTTISGSGFFLRTNLARELIPELRSITEDLELTAHLYASGYRVAYVSSAHVRMEETAKLKPMVRQRARWVRGHYRVLRHDWAAVAKRGVRGDVRALDIAIYMLFPTRVITRTAITGSTVGWALRLPFALPAGIVAAGMVSEWIVPAAIAFLARLVPRSAAGLKIALRQSFIGLLWFPIGAWAMATSRNRRWEPTPRAEVDEEEVDAAVSE